jgi:pimeloyl-ACP methyl ester carboxylesterase
LTDPQHVLAVAPLRSAVVDFLDIDSLPRLDAFLKLADDPSLTPAEKLAFAYSGWLLGSGQAFRDLDEAVRLWNAWFVVSDYLHTDDAMDRANLLTKLKQIEGVGVDRVLQMVPQLPLPLDNPGAVPGQAFTVDAHGSSGEAPVKYALLLPPEYSPHRQYPLIVTLRAAERTTDEMLLWWGGNQEKPGQSQRHGYIVIAPEYVAADQKQYPYDVESHRIVLESIQDVRKRFNVDSDRIFLTGHGMGGDAAFDMGMSHPDLFAGVAPIAGISQHVCTRYWENAKHVPFYIVGGQLHNNSFQRNAELGQVDQMLRSGFDVIYCDYMGRGYESYYEEIFKLFEWMAVCRRVKNVKNFDMKVLRPSENRFYWMQGEGFPPLVMQPQVPLQNGVVPAIGMTFSAKATPGNTIIIRSGASRHILWLSPEIVDFQQRVDVEFKGRLKLNQFITPEVETLLEDLRVRGDRQNLHTAKLVIE